MAKTSIKPNIESEDVVLTIPSNNVLDHYNPDQYDDVSRDIEIPVLSLINNTGPLANQFRNKSGQFVLGDLLLGESVSVIPVSMVKLFRETMRNGKLINFGSVEDKTRKIFSSASEAAKAGYYVDFDDQADNRVEEFGKIAWLVIAPDGDKSGEFILKSGDLCLAQARCSYQRGGYRGVFRKVFDYANRLSLSKGINTKGLNHSQLFLAAQPWTHRWIISSDNVTAGQNSWWEPRAVKADALPEDVVAWITTNYSSGN